MGSRETEAAREQRRLRARGFESFEVGGGLVTEVEWGVVGGADEDVVSRDIRRKEFI